ncbi:MAG: dTMP kinase [Microgenomates group bacterium]
MTTTTPTTPTHNKQNSRGLLITLEGGEGSGKTTQVSALAARFRDAGKDVLALREPGGTLISEQIREVVLSTKNMSMDFTTEVLLFQAARAQIYSELVLPSLEEGKIVLMDRSRDSSVVYQGIVREFGVSLVEQLNNISTKNTYPDITFLLDIPSKIGLERRVDDGGLDRIDMESNSFHEQVRNAYLELANNDTSGRWQIIDASRSIEEVGDELWLQLQKKITFD